MAAASNTASARKAGGGTSTSKKGAAARASGGKATTTKRAAGTRASKKSASTTKKAAAKKSPARKTPAKKAATTTSTPKTTAAKKTAKKTARKTVAKKTAATRKAATKTVTTRTGTKTAKKAAQKATPTKRAAGTAAGSTKAASRPSTPTPSILSNDVPDRVDLPEPRGVTKDGIAYTKDFDVKFLRAQRDELERRRASELARATRLEDEATSLIENGEMGDVQFDDEGGEGDTMVVQRDLDRVLSSQARQTIMEIDAALARIADGSYGYSSVSGRPIARERLEAIPETTVLAEEKVSGIVR